MSDIQVVNHQTEKRLSAKARVHPPGGSHGCLARGGDLDANFRLRLAVDKARANNMPKDNIERAIQRGTGEGKDGGGLEEAIYEGYAPHGVALMIEVVTDNRNRAVAEIRHVLTRYGGNMAEAGSVAAVQPGKNFAFGQNRARIRSSNWQWMPVQMMSNSRTGG
jgi:hypothetical protein